MDDDDEIRRWLSDIKTQSGPFSPRKCPGNMLRLGVIVSIAIQIAFFLFAPSAVSEAVGAIVIITNVLFWVQSVRRRTSRRNRR